MSWKMFEVTVPWPKVPYSELCGGGGNQNLKSRSRILARGKTSNMVFSYCVFVTLSHFPYCSVFLHCSLFELCLPLS